MMKYFYEVCFNGGDETTVVQSEKKLSKGDVVLFDKWSEFFNGTIIQEINTLEGITRHKKSPKVLRYIDIKEYNKENEKDIKKALLLNAMSEIEDDIKIKEQRNKLAGKDERYKDLLKEFEKLEEPIQIPVLKDNSLGEEESAE